MDVILVEYHDALLSNIGLAAQQEDYGEEEGILDYLHDGYIVELLFLRQKYEKKADLPNVEAIFLCGRTKPFGDCDVKGINKN
jgi:hypothetical protein